MCWGVSTGNGWEPIIRDLCIRIEQVMSDFKRFGIKVEASQVKEKFGGLRFYRDICHIPYEDYIKNTDSKQQMCEIDFSDMMQLIGDKVDHLIEMAELRSFQVCETCGTDEDVTQTTKGWIVTLCPKCMKEYKEGKRGE